MNKSQTAILRDLGWEPSDEDGAIMQHDLLYGLDKYLWNNETFLDGIRKVADSHRAYARLANRTSDAVAKWRLETRRY